MIPPALDLEGRMILVEDWRLAWLAKIELFLSSSMIFGNSVTY
jgi:hypothetical protein